MAFGTAERRVKILLYLSEDEAILIRDVMQNSSSDDESLAERNVRTAIFHAVQAALKKVLEI